MNGINLHRDAEGKRNFNNGRDVVKAFALYLQ